MEGVIIKGIAGFYYIYADDSNIYECKAKGIFRKDKRKPLVGDRCSIDILDRGQLLGNITKLHDRTSELIRPNVANVNQALVVFAVKYPEPNLCMLDKIILQFELQSLPVILCFNKTDLAKKELIDELTSIYASSGCRIITTCTIDGSGVDELRETLRGKVTAIAGPSGVGKSSLINSLQDEVHLETGSISRKAERGKHTTRCSEIIPIEKDTYLMDTPGFSSFDVFGLDYDNIRDYYEEFILPSHDCRFQPCSHIHEPDCRVKELVEKGKISKSRYDNYLLIYEELKSQRRY